MTKARFKLDLDERKLEQIAKKGIGRKMGGSGLPGKCPFCGSGISFRLPETTCPRCGKKFAPRA